MALDSSALFDTLYIILGFLQLALHFWILWRVCKNCKCMVNLSTNAEEEDLEIKDPKTITKISDVWVVQDTKPWLAV